MDIDFFMSKALEQAEQASINREVPIGAILVDNFTHKIVSRGYNSINSMYNSINHAEILVINNACKKRKNKFLINTTLFVTLEPCAMCASAISEVRISKIYFGAYDQKKGSLESIMQIYKEKHFFVPEVYGGFKEKECSLLLKNFFIKLRNK